MAPKNVVFSSKVAEVQSLAKDARANWPQGTGLRSELRDMKKAKAFADKLPPRLRIRDIDAAIRDVENAIEAVKRARVQLSELSRIQRV